MPRSNETLARNADVNLRLTSGVSRDLAARIRNGDVCDVFAPSSPAVIDEDLMNKKIAGSQRTGQPPVVPALLKGAVPAAIN